MDDGGGMDLGSTGHTHQKRRVGGGEGHRFVPPIVCPSGTGTVGCRDWDRDLVGTGGPWSDGVVDGETRCDTLVYMGRRTGALGGIAGRQLCGNEGLRVF